MNLALKRRPAQRHDCSSGQRHLRRFLGGIASACHQRSRRPQGPKAQFASQLDRLIRHSNRIAEHAAAALGEDGAGASAARGSGRISADGERAAVELHERLADFAGDVPAPARSGPLWHRFRDAHERCLEVRP